MVRRSHHGGVGNPVHVQKIVNSNEERMIDCEVQSCREEMKIAARTGMKGRECSHLVLVNNAFFPGQ